MDADVADAQVDAMILPAPPAMDLVSPWTRTVITAGSPTGIFRGADGTALDPEGCVLTAWEEGGIVTRACRVSGVWLTELVATGLPGVEDARGADLDGDGVIDVVSCSDGGGRCYVTFRGVQNVTTTLVASIGHGHAMQAAIADVNGDGLLDVVVGTRVGTPAEVAFYENPGALARTGAAWARHPISTAGWVMSLEVVGSRILVSDRDSYRDAAGVTRWDLYGARWLEQVSPGAWLNHTIDGGVCSVPASVGGCPQASAPAGACPAGHPMCTTRTPGDEMFLSVGDDGRTIYDCQSSNASADSRIAIHRTTDWLTWTHEVVPPASNVGHCQGVIPADVDRDGRVDLIVTTWKGNSYPVSLADAGKSGAYWLHATATGWERGEIATVGGKFDNAIWLDGCVITSEQLDPAGGIGVVAYCPSWTSATH